MPHDSFFKKIGRIGEKTRGSTSASLQWNHLTHGWLFIIANDSVVLSGSRRSITHRVRHEIEMESVSFLFIHLLSWFVLCSQWKLNHLHSVITLIAFGYYCSLLRCSPSLCRTGWDCCIGGKADGSEASDAVIAVNRDDTQEVDWLSPFRLGGGGYKHHQTHSFSIIVGICIPHFPLLHVIALFFMCRCSSVVWWDFRAFVYRAGIK